MDYRALNSITVKDKYIILMINELLDEFGGAHQFSKMDLLLGYHQIRAYDDDVPKAAFSLVPNLRAKLTLRVGE
jgi:hypothetical protein